MRVIDCKTMLELKLKLKNIEKVDSDLAKKAKAVDTSCRQRCQLLFVAKLDKIISNIKQFKIFCLKLNKILKRILRIYLDQKLQRNLNLCNYDIKCYLFTCFLVI